MTDHSDTAGPANLVPMRQAEAVRWHVRRHSGEMLTVERDAFARWHEEAGNRGAYGEIERLWTSLGPILSDDTNVVPFRRRFRLPPAIASRALAMAASLLAIIGGGYQYFHVWQHDHVTQGAARGFATLADGSRVVLDTGTAIDVAYSDGTRAVRLVRGRAYFDVRHNPARPFVIDAGGGEVRVLGTAFSVSRDGDGGRVVVERGKVRVHAGTDNIDITPNQSVVFSGGHDGRVTTVDAASELGWSRGRLVFRDRPIREVIAELDRYYPGMIVLTNDSAAQRRITAAVNLNDIDNWFAALSRSQHLTVRKVPGIVIVS